MFASFSSLIVNDFSGYFFFFLNDPATTEISPLPLPAAFPIFEILRVLHRRGAGDASAKNAGDQRVRSEPVGSVILVFAFARRIDARNVARLIFPIHPYSADRKSTRLNSSHGYISYAVFCLKQK